MLPAHLKAASSIDGSRAHSIVIESPPGKPLSADCLFTDMAYGPGGRKAGAPELYCRPDGTAYVCGGSDDVALPDTADEVDFDESKVAALIEQSKVLSPTSLDVDAGATLKAKQACYLPISNRTGNPIIGGKDGVYVAAGHSCWGITNSLGTGKVLSELILEGKIAVVGRGTAMRARVVFVLDSQKDVFCGCRGQMRVSPVVWFATVNEQPTLSLEDREATEHQPARQAQQDIPEQGLALIAHRADLPERNAHQLTRLCSRRPRQGNPQRVGIKQERTRMCRNVMRATLF
ncbi:hypothetical protein L1887_60615 [Cichorium endivia]|nr:hypothetical protein L1887_60615 [Cichorium endivia]